MQPNCTKCAYFDTGVEIINGFISFVNARQGRTDMYDAKPFVYCPWCGDKLTYKSSVQQL